MKRRVHIMFVGLKEVIITNILNQKKFNLDNLNRDGKCIDLITLKVSSERSNFYATILSGDGTTNNPYGLIVFRKNYDLNRAENIGSINGKGPREGTFEATVVEQITKKYH